MPGLMQHFFWFPSTNSARKYYEVSGHVCTYICVYIYNA